MAGEPRVSVLMVTYNQARYISYAIESVLRQSFSDWELIIYDDGSEDGTEDVVDRFLDDRRITYIKGRHVGIAGLSRNYNRALEEARGKYIAVLEGDDAWPSYKLRLQTKLFYKYKGLVFSWGRVALINRLNRLIGISSSLPNMHMWSKSAFLDYLFSGGRIHSSTYMVARDKLLDAGGFVQIKDAPIIHIPTIVNLCMHVEWSALSIDYILGYWRQHKYQTTRSYLKDIVLNSDFLFNIYRGLPEGVRCSLKADENLLYRQFIRSVSVHLWLMGRRLLIERRMHEARKVFSLCYERGDLRSRLLCLYGYIHSLFGLDLEYLAMFKRSLLDMKRNL